MSDLGELLVKPKPGFTPRIGELVSMMNYARHTTLRAVRNLTPAQLDYRLDESANSIGALLLHMAAIETWYQVFTFENREMTPEEEKPWQAAMELGELGRSIEGQPLEHYLGILKEVRSKTLTELAKRQDDWLYQEKPLFGSEPGNHYFMWFHVFEDEINHRGQIRLIRKRLPK